MNRIHLLRWTAVGLVSVLLPCRAEVTLDGTMGASGPLSGPDFVIPDTVGQARGTNLFHSFSTFNINSGENATFTGPAVIDNVISRVTGGSQSFIDGLLRSAIESANLWFINPSGVLFGPNASLDVDGSFHVSTADYLKLADGGRFEATNAGNSILTTAPPEAFGFLGENPVGISIQESVLEVPTGETLSVVGGDIEIVGGPLGFLAAPSGRINIASVDSAGEVVLRDTDLGVESFERFGRIDISQNGLVSTSGEGGGAIFIRGGEFVADNAFIFADTLGSEEGQGINIEVTGQVTVRNGALITVDTLGSGSGGDLTVETDSLEVRNRAAIGALTNGPGKGGNLSVEANRVFLSSDGALGFTGIGTQAGPESSGDVGDLTVRADILEVRNNAEISASTFGSGQGGNLLVEAVSILLSGDEAVGLTGISASAEEGTGDAGNLTVRAGSLEVREGAQISAATFGGGDGGKLLVEAGSILLSDIDARGFPSGIFATAEEGSSGDGGDLTVRAGSLEVREGAQISAATFGIGKGGSITITAMDTNLFDGDIVAASLGSGTSGDINITALNNLRLFNDSRISVETTQANAGDINLNVGNLLHLRDGSSITTSVAGGTGDGGNITIDPVFTVLDGASEVVARAREGSGGNIRITTDFLFRSPDSRIDASSEFGVSGTVEIDSPDTDITGGITTLPESFFDAAALLRERCGVRAAVGRSSFVVRGQGLPAAPDTYLSASYFEVPESGQAQPVSVTENSTGFGLDFSSMAADSFGGFELGCRNW
jgi:filamentous haemagglutinin family N-terminal domain